MIPKISINLALYEFVVKKNDNSRETFDFNRIPNHNHPGEYYDLLDILKNVFGDLKNSTECLKNEASELDNGKRIYMHEVKIKNRTIYGQVQHGYFGNERNVKNVPSNVDKGKIGEEDGIFEPYYFLLVMPEDEDVGCLILERKKGIGIRDIFRTGVLDYLQIYPDYSHYKISLRRAYPKELMENYFKKGKLLSLKYNIYKPSEDYVDELEIEAGKIETVVKVDGNNPITPEKFLENNQGNLLTFKGLEYDELRVVSSHKGNAKSFVLTNPESLIPYLDVTDEITELENGNPKLDCIDKVARKHAKKNFTGIWEDLDE